MVCEVLFPVRRGCAFGYACCSKHSFHWPSYLPLFPGWGNMVMRRFCWLCISLQCLGWRRFCSFCGASVSRSFFLLPWDLVVLLGGLKGQHFEMLLSTDQRFVSLQTVLLLAFALAKRVIDIYLLSVHPSCTEFFLVMWEWVRDLIQIFYWKWWAHVLLLILLQLPNMPSTEILWWHHHCWLCVRGEWVGPWTIVYGIPLSLSLLS